MNDKPLEKNIRTDLIYPKLSYKIVGIIFDVFNDLGSGYLKKYYQKAISAALKDAKINFEEQVYTPVIFKGEKIGRCFLDFLIDDKMVLELKIGDRFSKKDIGQVYSYLKANKLQLGLLVNFTSQGVKFKRILNIKD